jgi:ABC-type transport system substrate-binding protein
MRDANLQPRITRRGALKMVGAAVALRHHPVGAGGGAVGPPHGLQAVQPATLDPQKMRVGGLEYNAAVYVFNRLPQQDPHLQVQPDLATSWEASEDFKTWTLPSASGG